jgi:hypothetical protein
MIELGLLLGLGAVGYMLAKENQPNEHFTQLSPRPAEDHDDSELEFSQSLGHNNEVPFFGGKVTQSMYSGATDHVLDHHAGTGKEYYQKQETASMFDTKPGTGNPFGGKVESDFYQSRMVTGQQMKNVFPVDQVHVAPGSNDGYTNLGKGGFQQSQLRDYALPKTTDETRIVTKPKVSYEPPVIPGVNPVTKRGIHAEMPRLRPEKAFETGMERVNTTVGAQTATKIYPKQVMKIQARESTGKEYFGGVGGNIGVLGQYIRSFVEPYAEFMKLTAEGRPNPKGPSGNGLSIGPEHYSSQSKRNEQAILDATRINSGLLSTNHVAEHLGSFKYTAPIQSDINLQRNHPDIQTAFVKNPFTQPLTSY